MNTQPEGDAAEHAEQLEQRAVAEVREREASQLPPAIRLPAAASARHATTATSASAHAGEQLGGDHASALGHERERGQRRCAATTRWSPAGCPSIGSRIETTHSVPRNRRGSPGPRPCRREDQRDRHDRDARISATTSSSQKPARVSAILRSSTARQARAVRRAGKVSACGGHAASASSRGEGQEQLLEPAAVGGAQLEQDAAERRRRSRPTASALGLDEQRAVGARRGARPAAASASCSAAVSSARTITSRWRPAARALAALGDDLAVADHDELVGDRLDLAQQVRGQQHGPGAVGEVAQQLAHPEDALGVEAVGGLVEDQHARVAEQRVGDAEPLAHAERVVADALLGGRVRRQPDALEHLGDARARSTPRTSAATAQHLAAGAAGVLGGGVEQHADARPGLGSLR